MNIRFHLWIGSSAAVVGILTLGLLGIVGSKLTFDSLRSVYEDRLAPLELVKNLSNSYMVRVQDATLRMHNGEITAAEGRSEIVSAQQNIERSWREYRDHRLTQEEQGLLGSMQLSRDAADQEIEGIVRFIEVMEAQGHGLLAGQLNAILGSLDPTTRPIGEALDRLAELHLREARLEYNNSEKRFLRNLILSIVLLVFSAGAAIWAAWHLHVQVARQLKEILVALEELLKGNLNSGVPSHPDDELGRIGEGINRLVHHLRRIGTQLNAGATRIDRLSEGLTDQIALNGEQLHNFAKRLKIQGEVLQESAAIPADTPAQMMRKERLLRGVAETSLRGHEGLLQIVGSIQKQQERVKDLIALSQELSQTSHKLR